MAFGDKASGCLVGWDDCVATVRAGNVEHIPMVSILLALLCFKLIPPLTMNLKLMGNMASSVCRTTACLKST